MESTRLALDWYCKISPETAPAERREAGTAKCPLCPRQIKKWCREKKKDRKKAECARGEILAVRIPDQDASLTRSVLLLLGGLRRGAPRRAAGGSAAPGASAGRPAHAQGSGLRWAFLGLPHGHGLQHFLPHADLPDFV